MQAVILAAGKSSRFYPFTSRGHKSMVQLLGKPLLQHTLESLHKAKCTEVIIVVGEKSPIPDALKSITGLAIRYVVQKNAHGMGHALLQAAQYLDETFFLLSGYHADIADFADELIKNKKQQDDVVLLAKEDTVLDKYGVVETQGAKVLSLTEKPQINTERGLRVIGIYLLNKQFLQTLHDLPVEEYHFEKALDTYAKEKNVSLVKTTLPTITLKHAWDLLGVKDYLLSKQKRQVSKKAYIAKNAVVSGNVVVAPTATILEGACIKGPCYVGENVVVGNNAILRNGVTLEQDVVIGATMEVKDSILMDGATTHTGFIGDSVVGQHSRLAAGFCTANVRFDRKFVTTIIQGKPTNTYRTHLGVLIGDSVDAGVNVVTMPGVIIGNTATVGPMTTIFENVEDNTMVYTKVLTVTKKKK